MNGSFTSGVNTLARHLVLPTGPDEPRPGMILCHGFPIGPLDARRSAGTFPQLIDRIAHDLGYAAMTFNFRGTGTSTGDFSLQGWVDDLRTAIDYLIDETDADRRGTGRDQHRRVDRDLRRRPTTRASRAAALLEPTGRLRRLGRQPAAVPRARSRRSARSRTPGFPSSSEEWTRAFRRFRPTDAARRFAPRPLMVMHGEDDERVPVADGRQLATSHGSAELSLFPGAGHRLRHDPRAVAVLLGWLDRLRNAQSAA